MSERGIALLLVLIVGVLVLVFGFSLLRSSLNQVKISKRSGIESEFLVTAHTLASLMKQELLTNYQNYLLEPTWASCRQGTGNVSNFLSVLRNPADSSSTNPYIAPDPINCQNVLFQLKRFHLGAPPVTTEVALSGFRTVTFIPNERVNDFTSSIQITDFNLELSRNQILGEIIFEPSSSHFPKTLRMSIDLKRTVDSPARDPGCKICRTIAGSVCCSGLYELVYLERGSGRLMSAVFNPLNGNLSLFPVALEVTNPRAVAIKGTGPSRIDYDSYSFCIQGLSGSTPVRSVIDTATKETKNYFLMADGKIIIDDFTSFKLLSQDLKIESIAYFQDTWWLLRSDGQIQKTSTIEQILSFQDIVGLRIPNAQRLTMGLGASKCP